MEAATESEEISKRGMKEAAEEAKVKAAATTVTAFLSLLVGVHTDRCILFQYSQ